MKKEINPNNYVAFLVSKTEDERQEIIVGKVINKTAQTLCVRELINYKKEYHVVKRDEVITTSKHYSTAKAKAKAILLSKKLIKK
jgi:hypothetical protein